jgi:hypothetical protein
MIKCIEMKIIQENSNEKVRKNGNEKINVEENERIIITHSWS